MKKIAGIICLFVIYHLSFAQGESDALRYGRLDINGTARFMGMAGAFSSLGGDISAVALNPAGIGVYRSSEIVGTVGLNLNSTSTKMIENTATSDLFKVSFDNLGFVGSFINRNDGESLVSFNFGISYNKLKNYNRTINAGNDQYQSSLSDYMAARTTGFGYKSNSLSTDNDDVINNKNTAYDSKNWLSVLGWNGYAFDEAKGSDTRYQGIGILRAANMLMNERGGIDEYNFSLGGNVGNILYFGASLGVTDINYQMTSLYKEEFFNVNSEYQLYNSLETRGRGYNGKFGLIVRPVDNMRIGASIHTPTYYQMTDYFHGQIDWSYPNNPNGDERGYAFTPQGVYDYSFRTPLRVTAGMSFILGKRGILSFDYEMMDNSTMAFHERNGMAMKEVNSYIKSDNKTAHTIKVGGEYRVTPEFSLRAGVAHQMSGAKTDLVNNNIEMVTVGTVPQFYIDRGVTYGTLGAGYRFGSVFLDGAFVYRQQKENFFNYSALYDNNGDYVAVSPTGALKHASYNLVLTLGKKF